MTKAATAHTRAVPGLQLAVSPDQIEWSETLVLHGMTALPAVF